MVFIDSCCEMSMACIRPSMSPAAAIEAMSPTPPSIGTSKGDPEDARHHDDRHQLPVRAGLRRIGDAIRFAEGRQPG